MRTAAWALLCCALAAEATAATDRQARTFAWRAGRALAIEITSGAIRIEGSRRDNVELAIQRTAPTTHGLADLAVAVDETPERVSVRIVQPAGRTDAAFTSDLVVRVPADADLALVRIGEGRLVVQRFNGRLSADVRRGPIEATDVSGTLRLETGIGTLTVSQARLVPDGLLRLRAFNGDVRLQLPAPPANARVLALALNGHIRSDLPMTTRESWGPRWSEATLGTGEPVISVDVVNGSIDIQTR
jgi:hypothetical protein